MITGIGMMAIIALVSFTLLHGQGRLNKETPAHEPAQRVVRVCSYCNIIMGAHPDAIRNDHLSNRDVHVASEHGIMLTHGICPACYEKMIIELDKENPASTLSI